MANILTYIRQTKDISFEVLPYSEVDSLVLTRLSYIPFGGIVPTGGQPSMVNIVDAATTLLKENPQRTIKANDLRLLGALIESNRFSRLQLHSFVEQTDIDAQKQFAALCIHLPNGAHYVSFRGTDNTLVGWKEDLNMTFLSPVPSQQTAVEYLTTLMQKYEGPIHLGGHSKGGNLAVYAASFLDENMQSRIEKVHSFDGPGFLDDVLSHPGYRQIIDRTHTYLPQSSIVGMLLEHEADYTVIQSRKMGIMQHNLYAWKIKNYRFIKMDSFTASSQLFDKSIKQWVDGYDKAGRAAFIDALYDVLSAAGARTLKEFTKISLLHAYTTVKRVRSLDEPTKKLLSETLVQLFKAVQANLVLPTMPKLSLHTRKKS